MSLGIWQTIHECVKEIAGCAWWTHTQHLRKKERKKNAMLCGFYVETHIGYIMLMYLCDDERRVSKKSEIRKKERKKKPKAAMWQYDSVVSIGTI